MDEITKRTDHLAPKEDQDSELALSRRTFVSAIGALVALPVVSGGVLMPAWADKAHAAGNDSNTVEIFTKLIVVKKNEFGIVVGDVAGNKKTPVAGATVRLISLENGKRVEGVSDSEGKVLLDVSSLTALKKDENGVEMYTCFAVMEVSANGYRNYRTGRINVEGGRGIMAPTRKHDNENVYPQMVTFDDWDVLYTTNSFAVTSGNDVKHTIKVELVAKVSNSVMVKLTADGRSEPLFRQEVKPVGGVATLEVKDYFLLNGYKNALPTGAKFYLVVEYGTSKHTVGLSLQAQDAPSKVTAPGSSKVTLSPFNPNNLKPQITLPPWVPVMGGKPIDVWMPTLPMMLWFDPYGFVMFIARTGELGYKYKNSDGKVEVDAWKYHPRKTAQDQWSEANNERKALTQKFGKAVRGKIGLHTPLSYTDVIKATAMVQIAAAGKWRNDEALWRFSASLQAVLAFNVSYSQQFMVGPIPAIFEFSFLSSITVGLTAGIATTELGDIDKYTWDYGNDGISVTIVLAPSLSFGVGIKGLLSASIQGQISFSFCVAVRAIPHDAGKKLTNPHLVMGLVAQVNVVVQAFIFSKTFNMWEAGDPTFFDNWNGKVPGSYTQSLQAQAEEPALTDFDDMQIIDDAVLGQAAEFASSGFATQALSTQSEETLAAFDVVEVESQTDDGVTYRSTLYTPVGLREDATSVVGGKSSDLAAASSSMFTEQSLQVQDTAPAEATYEQSGNHDYNAFVEERDTRRFKGIASQTGLVPANDLCVAKSVFSDPRIKAIRIGGNVHLFRISTVQVGGQSRTRVVGQVLKADGVGAMRVYDFDPPAPPVTDLASIFNYSPTVKRNDYYDYDFDVVFTPKPNNGNFSNLGDWITNLLSGKTIEGMLTFFIISGRRGDGNGTKYADAACNQLFSIVRYIVFSDGDSKEQGSFATVTSDPAYNAAGADSTYKYHSFSCPQIHPLGSSTTGSNQDTVAGWMLTYLDRAGKTADDAVSAGAGKAQVGMGVCFIDSIGRILPVQTKPLLQATGQSITDSSVYEMTCSSSFATESDNTAWHLVMMRGRDDVFYYLLRTATLPNLLFGSTSESAIKTVKAISTTKIAGSEPMRLVEWPGKKGTFLTSHGGKLQKVTIAGLGGSPTLQREDCGPSGFNVNSFGVDPTGNVIFWPACNHGNAGYSYDAKGNGTKRKWTEVHQIMGSRLRNGKFSDPFVYGEVKHDMHMLQVIDYMKASSLTMVSVDMNDAKRGHADLWFTSIPLVKCANVIGCEAASPFNYPGEKALFYITVRNDGNTYLSGFNAKLSEQGKGAVSTTKVVFSQATLCESGYNPTEGGKLKDVEPDYALAPGKTSVYQVEIEIPKDWKNEKKVSISSSGAIAANSGTVQGQSTLATQDDDDFVDEDVEEYIVGSGDYGENDYDEELDDGAGQMPFDILEIQAEDTYDDDAEEEYRDAPINDVDGQNSVSTKSTIPKTGDVVSPFGLAATALAAAGAGMVAYSKRRSELEGSEDD